MPLMTWLRSALGIKASDPALNEGYWTTYSEMGTPSAAGTMVSATSSLRVSAVYRCVSILANSAALLPGGVYRKLPRGREEVPDHPVRQLLWKRPNPYQRPFEFKRVMVAWAILRGSAYARIFQRPGGKLELWPLHPDRVRGPEMLENGQRRYLYRHPVTNVEERYIADEDILVVNGLSLDGLRGLAMSDLARDTIGAAAAMEQYGATLFARGARFSGAVKLPPGKSIANPEARRRLADSIRGQGAGQGEWWGVPVLEDGMEWQSISMSADDAQFLETRKFTISDIARWFGVPPHMIGDVERSTSWGTGIEAQTICFVTYGLMPWLSLFEQSFEAALISAADEYLRFNVSGLLRADSKTRFDVYSIAIDKGIYSPNDCRELEDENPREGGDVYVTPTAPQQSAKSDEKEPDERVPDDEDDEDEEAKEREKKAAALAARIDDIEARLAAVPTPTPEREPTSEERRAQALVAVKAGAAALGLPEPDVRKLLSQARPKERV